MKPNEYDGLFFVPTDEDEDGLKISFFTLNDEHAGGHPVANTPMGDCWHVAYFKEDENAIPVFDEAIEAIFVDPVVYVKGLAGGGLYGCMIRKTTKSGKWFDDYLTRAKNQITMLTSNNATENI